MNEGREYWESLSFDERIQLLKDGDFFNGFANYLWDYLPIIAQIYIGRRKRESENYES
jgi:hypothetical protein